MDYNEFVLRNGVATQRRFVDNKTASKLGSPLFYKDNLVGYYIEEGYSFIGLPIPKVKGSVTLSKKMMWRMAFTIVCLNPDKSVDLLVDFMELYLNTFYVTNGLKADRGELRNMIDFCFDKGEDENVMTTKKYFWITDLTLEEKQAIVMMNMNDRASTETLKVIDNAIDAIMEEGLKFITVKEIKQTIDTMYENGFLTTRSIQNYISSFKDKIEEYNQYVFGTSSFQHYRKTLSIHKILNAIKVLDSEGERLSRRRIARVSGVHFNTVQNLWEEIEAKEYINQQEGIQKELDNFNMIHNG